MFQDNFVSGLNFDDKSGKSGKCPICFKMVSKLDRHLRIHYDEKPYACHMCDYRSNQSSNLNTHIRKKHNTVILVNKYWIKVEIKLAWTVIVSRQLFGTHPGPNTEVQFATRWRQSWIGLSGFIQMKSCLVATCVTTDQNKPQISTNTLGKGIMDFPSWVIFLIN